MARKSALAGPVGERLPCSQLRNVSTLTEIKFANLLCDNPDAWRISFIFIASI